MNFYLHLNIIQRCIEIKNVNRYDCWRITCSYSTKLLYLRKQFINCGLQYINYIKPLTQLKLSTEYIKEYKPSQNYRLLHLYNPNMLIEEQRLLHLNQSIEHLNVVKR